jgi:hypothetical protein
MVGRPSKWWGRFPSRLPDTLICMNRICVLLALAIPRLLAQPDPAQCPANSRMGDVSASPAWNGMGRGRIEHALPARFLARNPAKFPN